MDREQIIDLGYCPRCLSEFPMMTRDKWGVRWCHLCSFDLEEETQSERDHFIRIANEIGRPKL
ncbi:MAG: hypothetical protein C4567_08005 [Deltaproteobacteria bacterium]|nr:MAG: hypothetical protein C4567_08005 [Deltaproteobacteria bacterium]